MLGAPDDTEVLVAEMGARRVGDVKLLSGIARPDVVVVTNVGVAHMEIFGSWASIVEASAEPVDALDPGGVAILNADDPVAAGYADRAPGRVVTFGTRADADVRAEGVSLDPDGRASFRLVADGRDVGVRSRCPVNTWCRTRSPPPRWGASSASARGRAAARWATPPSPAGGWRRSRRPRACGS